MLPTKQVVSGQGVQDARGSNEVAHGSREGGWIDADGDKGSPDIYVPQETVVPLKQDTETEEGESAVKPRLLVFTWQDVKKCNTVQL